MTDVSVAAQCALNLMDLTTLNDDDTDERVNALCRQAKSPAGNTAAVCIYPRFIPIVRKALLESAEFMLSVIQEMGMSERVGFKAAGGVRTAEDAAQYLALADHILGTYWVNARHFRFGASSLLGHLLSPIGLWDERFGRRLLIPLLHRADRYPVRFFRGAMICRSLRSRSSDKTGG